MASGFTSEQDGAMEYYPPGDQIRWTELPGQYASQMKAREKYSWGKPLLVLLVAFIFMLLFGGILSIPLIISGADLTSDSMSGMDPADPLSFAIGLLTIATFIPAFGLALKIFGLGGLRSLSSVEGHLRWDRIRAFAPWTFLIVVVFIAFTTALEVAFGAYSFSDLRFLPISIIAIIICAPLQCAGEEYALRGFTLQTFSSWMPGLIFPMILQALIFGLLHGQYDIWSMMTCAFMGFCSAYITVKTGGLEGGICFHAANNMVGMLLTSCCAATAPTYSSAPYTIVLSVLMYMAATFVIMRIARCKGYILKK